MNIALLVVILYFSGCYCDKINNCKWLKEEPLYEYDKTRISPVKHFLEILKRTNIIYFLAFGSELGALRNRGLIINDNDIDIIVPIWMNYHIFKCKEYVRINPNPHATFIKTTFKLCGKNKNQHFKTLERHIAKTYRSLNMKCTRWGIYGCTHLQIKTVDFHYDIWLMLGNEDIYENMTLCKCPFSGFEYYCTEEAINNVIRSYGKNYKIPNKHGSGVVSKQKVIYPNNQNSKIFRINI